MSREDIIQQLESLINKEIDNSNRLFLLPKDNDPDSICHWIDKENSRSFHLLLSDGDDSYIDYWLKKDAIITFNHELIDSIGLFCITKNVDINSDLIIKLFRKWLINICKVQKIEKYIRWNNFLNAILSIKSKLNIKIRKIH